MHVYFVCVYEQEMTVRLLIRSQNYFRRCTVLWLVLDLDETSICSLLLKSVVKKD